MLPRKGRLTREQFTALLSQKGLSMVYNQLGTLKYLSQKGGWSVVTSSKHEKRAVARNRIRRRVYALLRAEQPPISGVLYLSKQAYSFEKETINDLFYALIKKTGTHR